MRRIDHLIIGQGLSGSALAWELLHRGKQVLVMDDPSGNRASAIAAGLFNPITGRVMTRTWLADQVFPILHEFYTKAESVLKKKFFYPAAIYRPFLSSEELRQWKEKSSDPTMIPFVKQLHETPQWEEQVHNPWGGIEIAQSGFLQTRLWMQAVREYLVATNSYQEARFNEEELEVGETIRYRDVEATNIIYCSGLATLQSKWYQRVPLQPLKVQTLTIITPAPLARIFSRGVFLVPASSNSYTVGATYEHPPYAEDTTLHGREFLQSKLAELIRVPVEIVHQDWGIRPTSPDRRPMLGAHPDNKNVIIYNGLGTKGVSLAPYFARHMADWLTGKAQLMDEVNISRFKALYSGLR